MFPEVPRFEKDVSARAPTSGRVHPCAVSLAASSQDCGECKHHLFKSIWDLGASRDLDYAR